MRHALNKAIAQKLILIAAASSCTGCSGIAASDLGESNFLLYGDAEAVKAFSDWQVGVNSGFQERADSPYWEYRRLSKKPRKAMRRVK